MTTPNTPQQPEGIGPNSGEPQQPPLFAPDQPYGQPGAYPQEPSGMPGAYPQEPYGVPGPYLQAYGQEAQQPYAAQTPQQFPTPDPEQPAAVRPPRPERPARPKVDPEGVPYGVGPFTLREAIFLGATALVLVASFLPFLGGEYADVFGYASAWTPAGWLVIPAAVLLVAAAALVLVRRLTTVRRLSVGSLSVDQFASAASVVTAGFYLGALFLIAGFPAWFGGGSDILEPGAGVIVGLVFSLVAVAVTTIAPALPVFDAEFTRRQETVAHPIARPASVVPRRERRERPPTPPAPPTEPISHFGQTGLSMPKAGRGEYAAYRRRGSQPAVDDRTVPMLQADGTAPGAIAYQPQAGGVNPTVPTAGAVPAPDAETTVPVDDSASADATRALPTDALGEPQTYAPGFVATDVPAVDPEGAAAAPRDRESGTDDRSDEDGPESGLSDGEGPAPVSAFSHVSARAATGSANAAPAADAVTGAEPSTAVFSTQPFWVYSPVPRPVVDEVSGATVFEIGPTAWALAILDRGSELVIRHDDGRVGVLQNLEGITRG